MRGTDRIAAFVVSHAGLLACALAGLTLFFAYPIINTILTPLGVPLPGPIVRFESNATDLYPDHPFIHVQRKFEGLFGNASHVAIALVVEEASIFNPETLAKLKRISERLDGRGFDSHEAERQDALMEQFESGAAMDWSELRRQLDRRFPTYPVNHDQTRSLTHHTTRVIESVDSSGLATVKTLMIEVPETDEEALALRNRVFDLAPELIGQLVTEDEKAALVSVQFVTDRLDNVRTYRSVSQHIQDIVESEEDENHRVYAVGEPVVVGWVMRHSWQIGASIGASLVLIFVLLWAYFRRPHGVAIPMVAAGVTVVWGLGFVGWMDLALDPLILVIPMIITARAISHTVQMAERFFEEYERLSPDARDANEAKRAAAQAAMAELIVPGTLGIITDVAGLLVILVTTIPQMRALGITGAFWVASIIFTVELLHPVLICLLPAPRQSRNEPPRIMLRFTAALANIATDPVGRRIIALSTIAILCLASYVALFHSVIGESRPGTALFWPDHPVNQAISVIGESFGGADTLVIYADGDRDHSAEDVKTMESFEALERRLRAYTGATRSVSLIDLVRGVNQAFRNGDPIFSMLSDALVFTYWARISGSPGAIRPLVTDDGRASSLVMFYPDHKGETIRRAVAVARNYIDENPIGELTIRLEKNHGDPNQSVFHPERLEDLLYYTLGPLLPTRAHTLRILRRTAEGYELDPIGSAALDGAPDWAEFFREEALFAYGEAEANAIHGRVFTWPEYLVDWQLADVDEWWEDEEMGLRAVVIGRRALIVQDLRSRDKTPTYQPSQSFTRGVELVLAGGSMGMLAAVNEEVERGHIANISLIFLVIFVLHSLTYRSLGSGAIILLQIATATMLSLAYMAVRGVGLDIHTLPVQAVGVGIGVDYAIYIVDRIRQEYLRTGDVDEAIRIAITTTGMAVTFTATTVVGGIFFWIFASLRFQAEMAQLLIVLMVINMIGAITVVPAFYGIFRPGAIGREKRIPADPGLS